MSFSKPKNVILLLVWCLFMGVTAISIGFGAAFPALNVISQPFVCSNGHLQLLTHTSHPQPGVTYTAEKWQCIDNQSGEVSDFNEWNMFLINGLIYGALLFAVIYLWWWVATKRRSRRVAARANVADWDADTLDSAMPPGVHLSGADDYELHELTRMYKTGQFSETAYQRKRQNILGHTNSQPTGEAGIKTSPHHTTTHAATAHAATSSTTANKTDEMEKDLAELKKLRDQDLITEQDYEQKKVEILSRL